MRLVCRCFFFGKAKQQVVCQQNGLLTLTDFFLFQQKKKWENIQKTSIDAMRHGEAIKTKRMAERTYESKTWFLARLVVDALKRRLCIKASGG